MEMVDLSPEDIQRYCLFYKLSAKNPPLGNRNTRYYYGEKKALAFKKDIDGNRAYSEDQINKLIFRKCSKNTVRSIIIFHSQLIKHFSPAQIFRVATNYGGSKNLEGFLTATETLKIQGKTWETLGISIDAVVSILSNHGGSKNLAAFINTSQILKNKGQTWEHCH